jgi:hypothetical protein
MPTATKPQKRTWLDALPEGDDAPPADQWLTRDELLRQLRFGHGVEVNPRSLVLWQEEGVIPYGVRRWRGGRPAVLYPGWMVDAIVALRQMQDVGLSLRQIADKRLFWSKPVPLVTDADAVARARAKAQEALTELARAYEQARPGIKVAQASVRFEDSDGGRIATDWMPIPSPSG